MRAIRRILVAIKDPEAKPLPSVAKAVQLASALGARIELFHALNVPLYVDTSGRDSLRDQTKVQKAQCLKQLEQLAAHTGMHPLCRPLSTTREHSCQPSLQRLP